MAFTLGPSIFAIGYLQKWTRAVTITKAKGCPKVTVIYLESWQILQVLMGLATAVQHQVTETRPIG
jgi:hypothetical protein